jgi:hypothetical protein
MAAILAGQAIAGTLMLIGLAALATGVVFGLEKGARLVIAWLR